MFFRSSFWYWHEDQSNEETETFSFYDTTLVMFIDKEITGEDGDRRIKCIQLQSDLEGMFSSVIHFALRIVLIAFIRYPLFSIKRVLSTH